MEPKGVRYSISQCILNWLTMMSRLAIESYIGPRFYGIWGDLMWKSPWIKTYVIGGTGYLQNPKWNGHGYEDEGVIVSQPQKGNTIDMGTLKLQWSMIFLCGQQILTISMKSANAKYGITVTIFYSRRENLRRVGEIERVHTQGDKLLSGILDNIHISNSLWCKREWRNGICMSHLELPVNQPFGA